jgi:long-chain acyl-CoA synthetase
MLNVIFLTGSTGFLGSQVARELFKDPDNIIIALTRGQDQAEAVHRLTRAWWDWPELAGAIGSRVEVIRGDLSLPRLGLASEAYASLARRVTHIIHIAAYLEVDAPLKELRRVNVQGTAGVLELAREVQKRGHLSRFSHVSTAYVAGARKGPIAEEDLMSEAGFWSNYEQSKFEGERLVQAARQEFPVSIFRPGMIVGDSRTGEIKTFNTIYFPLRLFLTGKLPLLPVRPDLPVNLVPVDYVARAIASLTFEPEAAGLTFHLTAPAEALPTAGELLEATRKWAGETLGLKLKAPLFVPIPPPPIFKRERLREALPGRENGTISAFLTLLPYFYERPHFLRANTDRLLGEYNLRWQDFLPALLEYAVAKGFLHRRGRTVHEQAFSRLESGKRRVTFHDMVAGKVITRKASEMREEVRAAAKALQALGLGPGDRVALLGYNSTRYLSLDLAAGLVGAVTIPLYYTSPAAEIAQILQASQARALFVGVPKLLERMAEFKPDLPIVSFCRGHLPEGLAGAVISWEEFLGLGAGQAGFVPARINRSDPATLVFTSGTTGQARGVMFNHANLEWQAEAMLAALPWKARNRPAAYLSFLPQSHVVEGILAKYVPYYLPARVDIYFLEEFKDLPLALPRARPSIFFAVPRLYEKIWESLETNKLGLAYLKAPPGLKKRLLGQLLKPLLLRKAGLDRCSRLIVGSAPVGEGLMRNFQNLGIEIHNAYGLTEAPLVTLNRPGRHRLGTVGEPLPQTQVRLAEDGEILVKGPQVTPGYFGAGIEQPFRDGWLATGDLGGLTSEGFLVIQGRKKELIATAYGKKVQPVKVESLLRQIPGIAEAMLVGEGKPYCVALLWPSPPPRQEAAVQPGWAGLDRAIEQINEQVSHPEQVKGWAVLANDLSIEKGDLTPNLKLKRGPISRRFRDVIEYLYEGQEGVDLPPTPLVLHRGAATREERIRV